MKVLASVLICLPLICCGAEPLFPTAEGTTWNYDLVQEKPSQSLDLTEPNEKEQFEVTYRIGGTQKVDDQDLRRLEIYRGETLDSVDLISIDENGITCPARTDEKTDFVKLRPPQKMLTTPLKTGTSWNFDGTIGQAEVSQHYEISGEEEVDVPAGKFHAWRIHCEQILPSSAAIDRWFVPGTGFVKVETVLKGPSGGTLQKTSLKLKEPPKLQPAPQRNAVTEIGKLSAGVASEPTGVFKTEFKSDTPALYVCWRGHELRQNAAIRAAFIADSVADVSADYQIDESHATAPSPNSSGIFTLSKPDGGWTPGTYRIEVFVDNDLAQTLKFKIAK